MLTKYSGQKINSYAYSKPVGRPQLCFRPKDEDAGGDMHNYLFLTLISNKLNGRITASFFILRALVLFQLQFLLQES
jgi:hypothetical protein